MIHPQVGSSRLLKFLPGLILTRPGSVAFPEAPDRIREIIVRSFYQTRPISTAPLPPTPLRRGGDILLSLALLLFTLPLMLLTALLVRFESPGPVLDRQQRIGLHGRPFTLFRFRSMCVDAGARGPVRAAAPDPRITRVGAVIRLTRIDELPQLVNVLRGEMSLHRGLTLPC